MDLLNSKTNVAASLEAWDSTYFVDPCVDIVINATTIGLFPDVDGRLKLEVSSLLPRMVVADGIHNPPQTNLIRDAKARGCTTLDGLGMPVNQGVIAVKHWSGVDVDPSVMWRAVVDPLA